MPFDKGRWNADNIRFYNSYYEGKSIGSALPIKYIGKEIFFRDIYLFIERAKEVVSVKGGEIICNNL